MTSPSKIEHADLRPYCNEGMNHPLVQHMMRLAGAYAVRRDNPDAIARANWVAAHYARLYARATELDKLRRCCFKLGMIHVASHGLAMIGVRGKRVCATTDGELFRVFNYTSHAVACWSLAVWRYDDPSIETPPDYLSTGYLTVNELLDENP